MKKLCYRIFKWPILFSPMICKRKLMTIRVNVWEQIPLGKKWLLVRKLQTKCWKCSFYFIYRALNIHERSKYVFIKRSVFNWWNIFCYFFVFFARLGKRWRKGRANRIAALSSSSYNFFLLMYPISQTI
jgi:hypothetical protein